MTGLFEDATMRDLNIAHYCANGSAAHPTNMHSSYNSVYHHLAFSDASNVCTFIFCHIWGTNWKPATEREFEIYFFCSFMGKLGILLPPLSIWEYWKTVEGGVMSMTNISVATQILLVLSFSFMENLSLLWASSRGSHLILYSTHTWGVCECKAAQMNEWTNTPTAGEYDILQSWARFLAEKISGGMLC